MMDGVNTWQRAAAPEEAKRWELLQRQASSLLLQHGVRPIGRVGQPIDLHYHEVVAMEPSGAMEADHVVRVLEMGFETTWSGRKLLRRARVVASTTPAPPAIATPPATSPDVPGPKPQGENAHG